MSDTPRYKRLNTIDNENLIFDRNNHNNLGYEVYFDDFSSDLLTSPMFFTDEEKELMDNGGKIRVAFWIESYSNES